MCYLGVGGKLLIKLNQSFNTISYVDDVVPIVRSILIEQDEYDQEKEHVFVIGLDLDRQIKYVDLVAVGTLDSCYMHPREVFRRAVTLMASSIILVHNHPSQDVGPSPEDFRATYQCMAAGKILGIPVDGSLIISTKTSNYFQMPKRIPILYQNLDFN